MVIDLRALTLHQPWSWLFAHGWEDGNRPSGLDRAASGISEPKGIENRPRALSVHPRVVCLHAGLTVDGDAETFLRRAGFALPEDDYVRGAIESVAYFTGRVFRSAAEVPAGQRPWWSGPLALEVGRVVTLAEPVPCRGYQGLWTPPRAVEEKVRAQVDVEALLLPPGGAS